MHLPFFKHRASTVEMLAALGCMSVLTFSRALSEQLKGYAVYPLRPYDPSIVADSLGAVELVEVLHARCVRPWAFRIEEWPEWPARRWR